LQVYAQMRHNSRYLAVSSAIAYWAEYKEKNTPFSNETILRAARVSFIHGGADLIFWALQKLRGTLNE